MEENTNINTTTPSPECCMCGDSGLSYELFICKLCHFRSQHRYCSNQYPKAETYNICNWCLSQKDESGEKTQNSSNSSSLSKNNSVEDQMTIKNKKKSKNNHDGGGGSLLLNDKRSRRSLQLQINTSPIKKQRSPEQSPASTGRKRMIITSGGENLRRSKSMDMANNSGSGSGSGIITKQVFRNKVRRYRLLDEVSSQ